MHDSFFNMEIPAFAVWLIVAVILAVIEALTQGLTTIWFAGGAVTAAAVSVATDSFLIQITAGLVVSVLLLVFTKPVVKQKLNREIVRTNIAAVIGSIGVAESDLIIHETGTVKADNKLWTAVLASGADSVSKGEEVEIVAVEGVKLVVRGKRGFVTNNDK